MALPRRRRNRHMRHIAGQHDLLALAVRQRLEIRVQFSVFEGAGKVFGDNFFRVFGFDLGEFGR